MADQIVIVDKGEFKSLPSRSFKEGLLGKTLESGLQELIEQHPQIIPGGQIAPGTEDPPRFTLLCREMPVGSWSLDFLLIDQYGTPTLLEAKLAENPDSRRAVVGQIVEYATNAAEYWSEGKLREKASYYWNSRGYNIDDILLDMLDDDNADLDLFWSRVDKNLSENRIRLIIASDELRPEVRKIVEYLNRETKTIEILGLEIKCYGEVEDYLALVPTIIGQSQAVAEKKAAAGEKILWDYEGLHDYYDEMDNKIRADRLKRILDWAKARDALIVDKKKMQSFSIKGRSEKRLMTFWRRGKVYCFLREDNYLGGAEELDSFIRELNKLPAFDYNTEGVKDGRTSHGALEELSEAEFEEFLNVLDKYCYSAE